MSDFRDSTAVSLTESPNHSPTDVVSQSVSQSVYFPSEVLRVAVAGHPIGA